MTSVWQGLCGGVCTPDAARAGPYGDGEQLACESWALVFYEPAMANVRTCVWSVHQAIMVGSVFRMILPFDYYPLQPCPI